VCVLFYDIEVCLTCQVPYALLSIINLVLDLFMYFVYPHRQ